MRLKYFFSQTPGILRETVLNLSAWLNICTSNRSFANESCSYWPIACIYFMKNLLLRFGHKAWHTSKFEIMNLSTQKTQHEWILCYNKTKWDACVVFVNCPEMRAQVLDQRAVALEVQTKCADVKPLWESERAGPVTNGTINPCGLPLSPHFHDAKPLWLLGRILLRSSPQSWLDRSADRGRITAADEHPSEH